MRSWVLSCCAVLLASPTTNAIPSTAEVTAIPVGTQLHVTDLSCSETCAAAGGTCNNAMQRSLASDQPSSVAALSLFNIPCVNYAPPYARPEVDGVAGDAAMDMFVPTPFIATIDEYMSQFDSWRNKNICMWHPQPDPDAFCDKIGATDGPEYTTWCAHDGGGTEVAARQRCNENPVKVQIGETIFTDKGQCKAAYQEAWCGVSPKLAVRADNTHPPNHGLYATRLFKSPWAVRVEAPFRQICACVGGQSTGGVLDPKPTPPPVVPEATAAPESCVTKCKRLGGRKCNKQCRQSAAGLRGHVDPYDFDEAPRPDLEVESKIWMLGGAGENCDQVCGARHMGCDNGVLDYLHGSQDEMQNAQWQVDAFRLSGIDCNASDTTFNYGASAAYPAFSSQLPGLIPPKEDAAECVLLSHMGEEPHIHDECSNNHQDGCKCLLTPPSITDRSGRQRVVQRLCACTQALQSVEDTQKRLLEMGVVFSELQNSGEEPGLRCQLQPVAAGDASSDVASSDVASSDSSTKVTCDTAAAADNGAVVALTVLVVVLAAGLVCLLGLLYREKMAKAVPGVKQMNAA